MFELEIEKRVKSDPDFVWLLLSENDRFSDIAPDISRVETVSGEKKGMVRRLFHGSGRVWEEECIEWHDKSSITMQINTQNHPLPVTYLRRTFSMEEKAKTIVIKVKYEYTPTYGPLGFFINRYQIRPVLTLFAKQLIESIASIINEHNKHSRTTATMILKHKDNKIFTLHPDTRVGEACDVLTENRIGSILIINEDGHLAGILSERDIVNGISKSGQPIFDRPVSDFMTRKVIVAHPDDSIASIMACMTDKKIRHLPVVDNNDKILGVISIGDVVRSRIHELEDESETMKQYIEGRKWREMSLQIGRGAATEELG